MSNVVSTIHSLSPFYWPSPQSSNIFTYPHFSYNPNPIHPSEGVLSEWVVCKFTEVGCFRRKIAPLRILVSKVYLAWNAIICFQILSQYLRLRKNQVNPWKTRKSQIDILFFFGLREKWKIRLYFTFGKEHVTVKYDFATNMTNFFPADKWKIKGW